MLVMLHGPWHGYYDIDQESHKINQMTMLTDLRNGIVIILIII